MKYVFRNILSKKVNINHLLIEIVNYRLFS
jgi:hypothetical protein